MAPNVAAALSYLWHPWGQEIVNGALEIVLAIGIFIIGGTLLSFLWESGSYHPWWKISIGAILLVPWVWFGWVFLLMFFVAEEKEQTLNLTSMAVGSLAVLAGSMTLLVSGIRDYRHTRIILQQALILLQDEGKIDIEALASGLDLTKTHIRETLKRARHNGLVPIKARVYEASDDPDQRPEEE